ncbi:MAG: hypothetical protein B6I20_06555 [Bacteroidetes bacterium 4572_117]|nr:MAG: hypothetical protein B6I20_06555 [Bacteroidetes bacterium 4572_117]
MRNLLLAIILFLFIYNPLSGQENKQHPIDIQQDKCLEENPTTYGMKQCYIKAAKEWDKELNKYYKLLYNKLSDSGKIKLQDAQRAWIAFRDKEFALMSTFYYEELEGTMYHVMASGDMTYLIKKRALELKTYYETMNYSE